MAETLTTTPAFQSLEGKKEVEGMPCSFMGAWNLHNPIGQNFATPTFKVEICVFILSG